MSRKKKATKYKSGVRRRILGFSFLLLSLVICSTTITFTMIAKKFITEMTMEKYEYVNEKMRDKLNSCYKESDDLTSEYIANQYVQKSLENKGLSGVDSVALKKTMSYVTFDDLSNLFYMDNKQNVYTRTSSRFSAEEFLESDLYKSLEETYSTTKWIYQEDTLYHTEKKVLFIGRYVRHMEYAHSPGVIFLKMDTVYFRHMLSGIEKEQGVDYLILDSTGQICYSQCNGQEEVGTADSAVISDISMALRENGNDQCISSEQETGMVFGSVDTDSGFMVATYVPYEVLNQPLYQSYISIFGSATILCIISVIFSIHFSNAITKPIHKITQVMGAFDGTEFHHRLELSTNTELDSIGHTYNEMLVKIQTLLDENKKREQELRYSELNSLMYQLNPHFLYNTLDNIYMLARMNKDERLMKMIQSLSKLLRISLSKGKDVIELREELEHVCCYLDIQMIRNADLFQYEIHCKDSLKKVRILKLILQPIVENCIKHGFCDIYEGGKIVIDASLERSDHQEEFLYIKVWNNGSVMADEIRDQLNQMQKEEPDQLGTHFPQKQGGYGISNVVSRLRLKYRDHIGFYYETSNGEMAGTTCIIRIPVLLET